jgi:hypothetical protein
MAEILLSEEQSEIVARGDQSRSLLDNPAFLAVIDGLRTECAEDILTSNPDDKEQREQAYTLSRGLTAITEKLLAAISKADAVLAVAEANTHSRDEAIADQQY